MVSSIATFSWSSLRLRENIRFEAIVVVVLLGGGLISAPWHTATALCLLYLLAMPFSIGADRRSEEHTSELQSLMRNSYAVFCLKKTKSNKPSSSTTTYKP